MSILRIVKRDPTAINAVLDFNPSVFRYYIDSFEVKSIAARDGLKAAFLGMLDELMLPDDGDSQTLGNWSFSNPVTASIVVGNETATMNTYTGIEYVYRQAVQTMLTALIPATLGTYTGRTFKSSFNPMTFGMMYIETTNLDEITHGELVQDGTLNQFVSIENLGGTPRVLPTFDTTIAGYGPVQSGEQGTHGIDEFNDYRPLSYWNETIITTTTSGADEYYGKLAESQSGFTLDTSKILFATTPEGEALRRYSPIDLITFVSLIKLNYDYRMGRPVEIEI